MSATRRAAKLSEVCTKISDGTHHSPKVQFTESGPGRFKYVTSKNIRPWGLDITDITYVTEEVHRDIYARCNPELGDVLLTKDGANTGNVAINTLDEEFSLLSSVAVLKPRKGVLEPRYLRYFIESPIASKRLLGEMTGTAIRRIILKKIKDTEIPLAPLPEQVRIVAEIEKQFTRLDAGVAALRRAQANLKRYRAAVLKAACEGKFAPRKAVPYPKQALAKLGRWCGGGTPSKANRAFWTSGSIPWVSPKDMKTELISDAEDHITKAAVEQSATNLLSADAVLVVTRSGILAHTLPVAVTTRAVALNQDLKALQLSSENSSRYVALALRAFQQEILQKCTKAGTTVQSIEFPVFLRFEIPLPTLAEQKQIVAEVERRLSVIDELEAVVTANLARASRLRQSVLKRSFTSGS